MISGNATGFNNEPFQQSYPVYRESNTANVSLLFPQENEYRTGYPSPVGTPLEFHYTPGTQAAVEHFYPPAALPAQGGVAKLGLGWGLGLGLWAVGSGSEGKRSFYM